MDYNPEQTQNKKRIKVIYVAYYISTMHIYKKLIQWHNYAAVITLKYSLKGV